MKKKIKGIIYVLILLSIFMLIAFLIAYRYVGVGGKIMKVESNDEKGYQSEYYLFIPDTLKESDHNFLLVESNNTGFVDDSHKTHMDAAYDIIRFGQANRIAKKLGIPLLVPCFDRPETNWEKYTHALDRDTLLSSDGTLNRIDKQLLAMIADARDILADKNIQMEEKILMNGFSASGSFANRFTALYPEKVAATAAGGLNSMVILPIENRNEQELIYPVGVADIKKIAGIEFSQQEFSSVPQYYYMGEFDDNDALQYKDAYSDMEREIVIKVLKEDMAIRWENCKKVYESQGIHAQFHTFQGIGHETTDEINMEIVSFFKQVINQYNESDMKNKN